MDLDDLTRRLRTSGLAGDLSDRELRRLAEAGTVRETTDGEVLLEEDEQGDRLVVVLEGEVEVVKRRGDEEWFPICTLGPGSVLGEVGLILDRTATARVRTLTACTLFELERGEFEAMVSEGSRAALAIALALARLLAARLQRTNEHAAELFARAERDSPEAAPQVDSLLAFKRKLMNEWNF